MKFVGALGYVLHRVFTSKDVECTNLSVRVTCNRVMPWGTLPCGASSLKEEAARL
jgi:hypothetical protein